jgi:CubicO group peptidase (beta-lactamase class C family)
MVSKKLIRLALVAALSAATIPAASAPVDTKRVDAVFAAALTKDGPGCALGVYSGGRVVALKGYGLANLETGTPVGPDTLFNIGSVSKQFTAMSAIILADRGRLSLDDDIHKYLPEMPDYGAPITIRELIDHTSGLKNYFDILFIRGLSQRDPVTPDEIYSAIRGVSKLDFTPGSQERYSNSGYFLLGRIVERVSGQRLGQFEQANIFGPLGMTHTKVDDDFTAVVPGRASGYVPDAKGGYRRTGNQMEVTGDGGVLTTVRDLALWDEDFYRGKVWRPAIKAEMLRVNTLNNGQPVTAEPGVYYAAGLNLGERRGLKYISHGGKDLGFMADLTRYPDQHLTIALLCNQIFRIGDVTDGLADLYLADSYTQPAPADTPRPARAPAPAGEPIPPALLAEAPGSYVSKEIDAHYRIEAAAGGLLLRIGPHEMSEGPVQGFGKDVLGFGRSRLVFHRDGQGRILGFTYEGFDFLKQ